MQAPEAPTAEPLITFFLGASGSASVVLVRLEYRGGRLIRILISQATFLILTLAIATSSCKTSGNEGHKSILPGTPGERLFPI